jgi:hypothetical protein
VRAKRIKKLVDRIEALADSDDRKLEQARKIEQMRRAAALDLHILCRSFVEELNRHLIKTQLQFDPPEYEGEMFRLEGPNLFQINVRGRILQAEFEAGEKLISTEEFRVPYILEGAVRGFNQELLDREAVHEHLLFCCVEKKGNVWRFFDPRTYRTGEVDADYLTAMLEALV